MKDKASAEFSPRDSVLRSLRFWWLYVALMVLGGMIGWAFNGLRPPVYEARALLSSGIDYVRAGRLTELEEDKALEIVGDVIASTRVIDQVVAQAQSEQIAMDAATFRQIAFRERKGHTFVIRVQHTNPEIAAQLANIWLNLAYRALNDALEHALAVEQLQRQASLLESCFEAVVSVPTHAYCNTENLQQLQTLLQQLSGDLLDEKKASLGIIAALSFAEAETAQTPQQAVLYGRALLVFSGMLVGFVLAVAGVSSALLDRLLVKTAP